MSSALGAPDNDEPVGSVLARMRRAKRITGARLAALVGMSQPKISRIERGSGGPPDPKDVELIASALGADEATARALVERAARSHDRMTDWRPASAGWPGQQKTIADWESTATVIRDFELTMVPGLLQTSGYAKAILRGFQQVAPLVTADRTESALLAALSARIRRQEILADQAKSFQFILGEDALRQGTLSPIEMLAQINHLRQVRARNANVSITVVPDGAPVAIPLQHSFALYDDDLVLVDLYNTGLLSRGRHDVESYRRVFDVIEENATSIEPYFDRYEAIYLEALQRARAAQPGTGA